MVSKTRRLAILVFVAVFTNSVAVAKYLGVYTQIYHRYQSAYSINELEHYPSERRSQGWDGDKWVTETIHQYDYVFDDDGRAVEMERCQPGINARSIYEYRYDNGDVTEVTWRRYDDASQSAPVAEGHLTIERAGSQIVELDYEQGELRSKAIYELDTLDRIARVKLDRWSPFANAMRTSAVWTITYAPSEPSRISTITVASRGDQEDLVRTYAYSAQGVVISESNGVRQELQYENGRLSEVLQTTTSGQFDLVRELYDYDEKGRLVSIQTRTDPDSTDAFAKPDLDDRRVVFIYD